MATDAFTNTNGTFIGDHAAGGNTWSGAGQATASGEIQSNTVCADASDFFNVSCRATNSSVGFSQVVFKGGAYDDGVKAVHVRASGTSQGYRLAASISGGNIVGFSLWHGDASFITTASITPVSQASDQTVALKATTNGSNVEIRAWINGNPITFDDSAAGNGIPGTVYTNVAADTPAPILSGNPGFTCDFFATISAANSAFDNWTDVEPSAAAVLSSPTPSGTLGTQTTATIGATTDQSSGNFYVVVDSSANLAGVTATQIKAGQRASGAAALAAGDVAVSTTSPSVGVTGLVANTAYAYAAVQNNANGDSNIVTGTFTTASATAASGTTPGQLSGRRIAILMQS